MQKNGFTLVELLIVVAIIAFLAVIVIVAIDPKRRLSDLHNATRASDINTIATAIHIHMLNNDGDFPKGTRSGMRETQIGTATSGCAIQTGGCNTQVDSCVNISDGLVNELPIIPKDPDATSNERSGYTLTIQDNNIITVRACNAEEDTFLFISR